MRICNFWWRGLEVAVSHVKHSAPTCTNHQTSPWRGESLWISRFGALDISSASQHRLRRWATPNMACRAWCHNHLENRPNMLCFSKGRKMELGNPQHDGNGTFEPSGFNFSEHAEHSHVARLPWESAHVGATHASSPYTIGHAHVVPAMREEEHLATRIPVSLTAQLYSSAKPVHKFRRFKWWHGYFQFFHYGCFCHFLYILYSVQQLAVVFLILRRWHRRPGITSRPASPGDITLGMWCFVLRRPSRSQRKSTSVGKPATTWILR